jgi:hypothetical protein
MKSWIRVVSIVTSPFPSILSEAGRIRSSGYTPKGGAQLRVLLKIHTCAHRTRKSGKADDADDGIADIIRMVDLEAISTTLTV